MNSPVGNRPPGRERSDRRGVAGSELHFPGVDMQSFTAIYRTREKLRKVNTSSAFAHLCKMATATTPKKEKKDEGFLEKIGGTLARKKKTKEGKLS